MDSPASFQGSLRPPLEGRPRPFGFSALAPSTIGAALLASVIGGFLRERAAAALALEARIEASEARRVEGAGFSAAGGLAGALRSPR